MRRRPLTVSTVVTSVVAALVCLSPSPGAAAPAGTPHLPDLQTIIPTDAFSVVTEPTGKEFRYTHLVYDAGPGPLEVQPSYEESTGGYRGVQQVFSHDAAGAWSQVAQYRVPDVFAFHAEHGHFHFPLAAFGLYRVAADGSIGAPVALSPKVGFCIDDSYIYNSAIEHSGTFVGSRSACTDPSGLRGLSVGGADEYDFRDPGQAIPIPGVPDGTYWFKAVTDPNNDFVEANEANNETDVKVTISGAVVTAGEVRHPDSTPPGVTLSAPLDGSVVRGTVTLKATTPLVSPAKVEFVVDGVPLGPAVAGAGGWSYPWNSAAVVDGSHWVAARATASLGRVGTSRVAAVDVANVAPPPSTDALTVAGSASSDGTGARTATLTGLKGGNLALALVSSDGPPGSGEVATVSGSGLTWSPVRRANGSAGTSEVWKAVVPAGSSSVSVTATPPGSYDASLTLVAFNGSAGVGTGVTRSGTTGAAGVALTTTRSGSLVLGVGNDWDGATARTLAAGQTMRHQWVDTAVGDTFWTQATTAPTGVAGTVVNAGTTAPTSTQWNVAAVEVLAASTTPPPADTTKPTVTMTEPEPGSTASGVTVLAATAADNVAVASVTFLVDGVAVAPPDTAAPFMTGWDTTKATSGNHTLSARAVDTSGNTATSTALTVSVDNSAPPPQVVRIDGRTSVQATGTQSATGLSTTKAGDTLVAFVGFDGPAGAGQQSATVAGAGLTWTLVKRANTQSGVAEIWTARSAGLLTSASVTATPARSGYAGALTVLAFAGAQGTGVAGAAGAPSGAPSIYLPGVQLGSWVFAVGNDWDGAVARTPVSGQVLQRQDLVPAAGNTYWVQSTAGPATGLSLVTIADSAPVTDQWNYAAVEVRAASGTLGVFRSPRSVHVCRIGTC
jgi:hypothetical protein